MMHIIFITSGYPHKSAKENNFIIPEINYLIQSGLIKKLKVHIMPLGESGPTYKLPKNISWSNTLSKFSQKSKIYKLFKALSNRYFYSETLKRLTQLKFNKCLLSDLKRIAWWSFEYKICKTALDKVKFKPNEQYCIYTYWFTGATSAAIDHKRENTDINIKVITRTHGYDLYKHRKLQVRRKNDIARIDGVFPASKDGAAEILNFLPVNHVYQYYLGIEPFEVNQKKEPFDQNIIKLVSCAYLSSVKRIPLLANAIVFLAKNTDKKVEWDHFGGGDDKHKVLQIIENAPKNLTVNICGDCDNKKIRKTLHQKAYAACVNVSISEGGASVSLMESQEAEIPIIATNVGGNKEIANSKHIGALLSANPNNFEIYDAILHCHQKYTEMTKHCYENWRNNFNAMKNHESFYKKIMTLFDSRQQSIIK